MTRTRTLIASCCVALVAIPVAMACDKDKASSCDKAQRTVLKVNSEKSSCSSQSAKQLVNNARIAQGCTSSKGVANVVNASECESACPKQRTVNFLMRSLKGGCSDACASKSDVVSALRTMSTYEKDLICETSLDKMAGVANVRTSQNASCDPAACSKGANKVVKAPLSDCASKGIANVMTVGKGSACSSKSAKGVANVVSKGSCSSAKGVANVVSKGSCSSAKGVANVVSAGQGCDPAACSSKSAKGVANVVSAGQGCDPAACSSKSGKGVANVVSAGKGSGCCASKGAKVANANVTTTTAGSTCSSSTKYVAYGCDKSDRVARAAAKAYLAMMSELKDMNGAESCSLDAAKQVLATVMADMQKKSNTEVAAVSFGAVSDKKSGSSCSSK